MAKSTVFMGDPGGLCRVLTPACSYSHTVMLVDLSAIYCLDYHLGLPGDNGVCALLNLNVMLCPSSCPKPIPFSSLSLTAETD